ncbi:MAG TPA: condensation domain-containing protein, partial [Pyrinomonadaceae bacterium]
LRTSFAAGAGRPAQVVSPEACVPLPLVDLSALPQDVREAEARRLAALEARVPFDLARGPVLRCTLLRLAGLEHAALLTMHHIVSDAWSMGVLVKEVASLYAADVEGRESPLAELPVQYADYAAWQREWLRGEVLEEQLSYWRGQLAGAPPVLELPTDRPRPVVQTHRAGRVSFALPTGLSRELKELSRREGATLFMTLLAGFDLLLARHAGQSDVVVGTSIAGRGRLETEPLIGFFVNTLALRARLHDDLTFAGLLRRVRETTLGAFAHQDVPFEKLVEELQPERSLGHTPLFQVMFVLQNAPQEEPALPGVRLSRMGETPAGAKFDLTLTMAERDGGLSATFEYAADLFDAETVERMAGHLRTLLAAAATRPDARLSELPLLTEEERRRLVFGCNDTARDYPAGESVHGLFERQVSRTPDSIALTFGGETLTYSELNARANRLAHYLRRQGVSAESRVAVMLERSVGLVISLLAVLKAGGAYVPLDPEYPAERLRFMLTDCRPEALVTDSSLSARLASSLAAGWGGRTVNLDTEGEAIAAEGDSDPGPTVDDASLCYVIYTSGSTGSPKGAMNAHRGVVNRLLWMQEEYGLTASDVVMQKTPFSFDVSVWEFFWPLITGARLV